MTKQEIKRILTEQEVIEVIQEIKHSGMPLKTQELLIALVKAVNEVKKNEWMQLHTMQIQQRWRVYKSKRKRCVC